MWRRSFVVLLALAGAATAAGMHAPAASYEAVAIVTGQGEKNRALGLALALEDVLVKVSGDPRLIGETRVAGLDAAAMVEGFSYRDRLEGIPIHDEQGSYDRPHDLTVRFTPEAIDAALAALGRRQWTEDPRPAVLLKLDVTRNGATFTLTADEERGMAMRNSLAQASAKIGMPVVLPGGELSAGDAAVLAGSLVWSDAELGWIADWTIESRQERHRWQIRGVSFDDAFRNALRGAAQVLSGNGDPG